MYIYICKYMYIYIDISINVNGNVDPWDTLLSVMTDISVGSPLQSTRPPCWSSATWRCWWPSRCRSRSRWWCYCRWCRCCHLDSGSWQTLGGQWGYGGLSSLFFRDKSLVYLATKCCNQIDLTLRIEASRLWELKHREFVLEAKKLHECECTWSWPTNRCSKIGWSVSPLSLFSNLEHPKAMSPAVTRPDNCLRYGCPRLPWIIRTSRSPTWLDRWPQKNWSG